MNVNYEDLEPIIIAALKKANTANERIDNLPEPMVFKGTLGTGGTIESLPAASTSNKGFTYIVITDGTYAGVSAKAGDMFISDGSTWVLVPSSDEPSVIDDSVTSTALTWSSKKISDDLAIKSFTYKGDGSYSNNTIEFPTAPKLILLIWGIDSSTSYEYALATTFNFDMPYIAVDQIRSNGTTRNLANVTKISDTEVKLSHGTPTSGYAFNTLDDTYTVYYI